MKKEKGIDIMSAPNLSTAPAPKKVYSTPKYVILLAIGLFIMFGLGRIVPTWGPVTPQGVNIICIFIGTLYLLLAGYGLIVPSMLAMFAMVITKYTTVSGILGATFGTTSLYQLFLVYVLCTAITKSGAGAVMARWILSRKVLNGRPVLFCVVFMETVSLFACLVGASGAVLFFFTLIDSLCETLGYEENSSFKKVFITGAYIAAALGSPTLPFKGTGLLIFGLVTTGLAEGGLTVSYGSYILSCLINQIVFAAVLGLLMKPLFRCDISKLKEVNLTTLVGDGPTKMNKQQALCFWGFIVACMYSIILIFLPKDWAGYETYNSITQAFVFALMIVILSLIRVDKKPVMNPGLMFKEGIKWDIIYAYCAFSVIGQALSSNDLGIKAWLQEILAPIFGNMPFLVFALVLIAMTYIITNFFSNTATGLIMGALAAPYLVAFGQNLSINPNLLGAAICVSCSVAYLTPGAGNVSAVYHGQACIDSDKKWVWTYGLLMGAVFIAVAWVCFGVLSYIL